MQQSVEQDNVTSDKYFDKASDAFHPTQHKDDAEEIFMQISDLVLQNLYIDYTKQKAETAQNAMIEIQEL